MASFQGGSSTVNAASGEVLPPPPPYTKPESTVTLESAGVVLDPKNRAELAALAKERDLQRGNPESTIQEWRDLLDRA